MVSTSQIVETLVTFNSGILDSLLCNLIQYTEEVPLDHFSGHPSRLSLRDHSVCLKVRQNLNSPYLLQ